MKEEVIRFFQSYPMQIEVQAIPNRRADVLLTMDDKKIAIECQVSPMTVGEWEERTRDYNRNGIYVLWIFHIKRVKVSKDELYNFVRNNDFNEITKKMPNEKRIPVEILEVHHYYDGVYFMDYDGHFLGFNFHPVVRDVNFDGVQYTKVLERTKLISLFIVSPSIQLFKNEWLLAELDGNTERSGWGWEKKLYCKECGYHHVPGSILLCGPYNE
jgi:hypothetical protein